MHALVSGHVKTAFGSKAEKVKDACIPESKEAICLRSLNRIWKGYSS